MKNYEQLNEFEKKSINDYISLTKMFLEIISDKNFGDEAISLMKQNHTLMRIALQDLGVKFEEVNEIKELRDKIRDMELQQSMSDMSYNKISAYIENLKNKVKNDLEAIGLHSSVQLSFCPNLNVKIDIFNSEEREPDKMFYRDQQDFERDKIKYQERHRNFRKNFVYEVYDDNEKELVAIYDQSNIDKIVEKISDSVCHNHDNINVQIQNRFKKGFTEGKKLQNIPALKSIELTFYTLQSDIFLSQSFKSFR